MEDCPYKWPEKKFKRNHSFFYGIGSWLSTRFIPKKGFSHCTSNTLLKLWVENSVSAIKHLGNGIKSCFEVFLSIDQANPVAYSCSFTLHTSYIKLACLIYGDGGETKQMTINTHYHYFCANL